MELLEQCQFWFEQEDAQKVIDALEVIPAGERTPELDSELAKAYIAIAEIGEREPYEKALELLKPHEEHFNEDHCWNYRMACAYYYLDEEGPALRYFEKALKARPGDKDTQEYIDDCRRIPVGTAAKREVNSETSSSARKRRIPCAAVMFDCWGRKT